MLGPQRRAVQEDCREAEARAIIRPQCTDTSSRFVPHPVLAWLETMHQIPLHNRREIALLAVAINEKNWGDKLVAVSSPNHVGRTSKRPRSAGQCHASRAGTYGLSNRFVAGGAFPGEKP